MTQYMVCYKDADDDVRGKPQVITASSEEEAVAQFKEVEGDKAFAVDLYVIEGDIAPPQATPPPKSGKAKANIRDALFNPSGRRGRLPFFGMGFAHLMICGILAVITEGVLGIQVDETVYNDYGYPVHTQTHPIVSGVGFLWLYFTFVNTSKRLHDMNKPAWLFPLVFIPLLNLLLLFSPGTKGENKYGEQP